MTVTIDNWRAVAARMGADITALNSDGFTVLRGTQAGVSYAWLHRGKVAAGDNAAGVVHLYRFELPRPTVDATPGARGRNKLPVSGATADTLPDGFLVALCRALRPVTPSLLRLILNGAGARPEILVGADRVEVRFKGGMLSPSEVPSFVEHVTGSVRPWYVLAE